MDKRQIARYNADKRVRNFMTDHDAELAPITIYAAEKAGYDGLLTELETAEQIQVTDITVITADKSLLKETMANVMLNYILRAAVQANQLGNVELELSLDKPLTYILVQDDELALSRAKDLRTLMHNNVGILTVLQPPDFVEMDEAIHAYAVIQVLPEQKIKYKKAEGTERIPVVLDALDIHKINIGKIVRSYLPLHSLDFDLAAKVGEPEGIRHMSLIIHFLDYQTGVPLQNVETTITNGIENIVKYSSPLGWVRAYSLQTGNWSFTTDFETYQPHQQTDIPVHDDYVARFIVKLQKEE